ncbi:unnamed protein product [Sphagnum jensenii]|uniref:very-long-chain 3-oxoacyl-CoA synthase n=1 Tax=Sphagnum jensenii TaxID=128206 RepID=A0ABP0VAQ1_9BRYO
MVWIVCEHPDTEATGMLWFWSYIYYISKFYELLDTVLQFLAGKTPPNFFLHVYHHSLVILMSWAWIEYRATSQFVGILFNTAVHVVMYYYFYLKSVGVSPWWKRYVTSFQIVQFGFSLMIIAVTLGYAWQRRAEGEHALYPQCKGVTVVLGSLVFNTTLLSGFVDVLQKGSERGGSRDGGSERKEK